MELNIYNTDESKQSLKGALPDEEEDTEEQIKERIEADDDLHEIQADDDIGEPDPEGNYLLPSEQQKNSN